MGVCIYIILIDSIFLATSMANINNKVPIQFRCRPIRSNSCTTQHKLLPKPPQLLTLPLQIPTNTLASVTITTPPHIQKSINLSKPIVIDKNKQIFSQGGQKTKLKLEFHIPKKVGLLCDAGKQLVEDGEGKEVCNNKQRRDDVGDSKYLNGRGQKYKKKISLHSLHSDQTLKQAQSQTNFKQKNKEQSHIIDIKKPQKKQKRDRQRQRKTQLLKYQQYSPPSQHDQHELDHGHKNEDINFSNTSSVEDKNQNQRDLKDYESKATMKNQINLRIRANVNQSQHQVQQKEIKYMLMELADGHHQMMAMLKHIMKRDGTAREEGMMSRVQREHNYNEKEIRSKSVYRRSRPSNSHYQRQGLKINRVYNQMIISNTDPSFQSNIFLNPDRLHPMTQSHTPSHTSHTTHTSIHTPPHFQPSLPPSFAPTQMRQSTSTIRTNKLPSQIATILAQVIKENVNYNPIITLQMQLRQLISRRFQIFYLNYNYFLELLINLDTQEIQWEKFKGMLMEIPFLLDQGQVEVIRRSVVGGYGYGKDGKDKDGMPLTSINTPTLPIPLLAQKLRYFIYDRQPFDRNLQRLKIHQLKSILTSKCTQYQQKCLRHIHPQSIQTLPLQQLQKVFKQLRLQDLEIEIIIGKLCLESNNINQLKYRLVVDRKWLEMLAG